MMSVRGGDSMIRDPASVAMILGVLGGSGLYDLDGLAEARTEEVSTPFGPPSAPVVSGRVGAARLLFLPRHGRGHRLSPSEINYRANVFALKSAGRRAACCRCRRSARCARGWPPGDFVLPDQFIDKTFRRASTFFGDGVVGHVGFAEPTCPRVRARRSAAAAAPGAASASTAAAPTSAWRGRSSRPAPSRCCTGAGAPTSSA